MTRKLTSTHPMLLGAFVEGITPPMFCELNRPRGTAVAAHSGIVIAAGDWPASEGGATWVTVRGDDGELLYINSSRPTSQIPLSMFRVVRLAADRVREEQFIAAAFTGLIARLARVNMGGTIDRALMAEAIELGKLMAIEVAAAHQLEEQETDG